MKLLRASANLSLIAIAAIASAAAAADHESGWYLGGNVGQSSADIDDKRIAGSLLAAGFTTTSIDDEDRDLGYKILAGYQFNRYFALEGGYFDLGEFGFTATTQPPGTLTGEVTLRGLNFDLVGMLPFNERFSAFARIGANHAEAKSFFSGTGAVNVPNSRFEETETNYKFGLGIQYVLSDSWALRAEAERYRIDDSVGNNGDIDLYSIGVVYRFFGRRPAPAATAAAAPVVAPKPAPAPAPAPVRAIMPVPAKTEQYCSILDIQFDINADEIPREAREKLAVLATFLKKYPDTTAVIEGHTDNVGEAEYNFKLSQRRAESVVNYLVDTFRIAPSRLKAVGYGETLPLASNATQEGMRRNRRIGAVVACATDVEGLTVASARITTMAIEMEFDRNQATVKPQYRDELAKVAKFLKANPSVTATVEGHTADLEPKLAMEISQRRAQNVVDYLVNEFGIARSRLSAEGFGQTRRFAYNTSLEGQQDNRRVNIIINYAK